MISTQYAQILGVGIDLVDIGRIERMIMCYGQRFLCRVFTEKEREYAQRCHAPGTAYGKRFAAKEAFSKAIGCGIGEILAFKDIEIINGAKGQPFISLALQKYEKVFDFLGCPFTTCLSLTDEYPYAQAFVVVSASPLLGPTV